MEQRLTPWLDRQRWLDTTADALQPAVRRAFDALGPARRHVKNFLHGTWLGHPLHPALTDIPLGAWTTTLLLDALGDRPGRRGAARAADVSLALGLAGAVGAAATGLTDWSDTDARPRRIGVAHAALNGGATLLFAASLLCRGRANRDIGRGFALAGYLAVIAAAFPWYTIRDLSQMTEQRGLFPVITDACRKIGPRSSPVCSPSRTSQKAN